MTRLSLLIALLISTVSLPAMAEEALFRDGEINHRHDEHGDGFYRPGRPGRPGRPDRPGRPGRPGRPFPQPGFVERIRIQREFRGDVRIFLSQLVNMNRYYGLRLNGVTLIAATRAGRGDATFCASLGCDTIRNVGTWMGRNRFRIYGEWVDQYAWNWSLNLRGNFLVDSIELEFSR